MSDDHGSGSSKVLGVVAAFAAAYVTRKVLMFGWKQVTGKEPPTDLNDPQVRLGEALGWAVVLGVGIETARLLAARAVTRKRLSRQTSGD